MQQLFDRSQERRLVSAIRAGSRTAYTHVVNTTRNTLIHYATSVTRSREEAEEVVQDILTRLWIGRRQWTLRGSLTSYLLGAVRNGIFDRLRREHRHRERLQSHMEHATSFSPDEQTSLDIAIARQLEEAVIHILNGVPERWRAVFLLCVVDGVTQEEAARLLGLTRSVVNLYMSYVRHEIATQLIKRGFDPPAWLGSSRIWSGETVPDSSFLPLRRALVHVSIAHTPDDYTPERPFSSITVIRTKHHTSKSRRFKRHSNTEKRLPHSG